MKVLRKLSFKFLLLWCFALNCSNSNPGQTQQGKLLLIASHVLTVPEPSGLTTDQTGSVLWVVGNKPTRVYQLSLNGNTLDTLNYVGEDLEGIEFDPSDTTLWVVEERSREVLHLDIKGKVLSRHQLDLTGKPNSGLEGIGFDEAGNLFVLNEKEPGLFIELNADLSIKAKHELDFANDYSGLEFDSRQNGFWIVSDQNEALYFWNSQNGVTKEYSLPFPKAEGVAIDGATNRIYIVSDSENKLYIYAVD